jgi:hypothetical protein
VRGSAITRPTFPAASSTSIDIDCGSMKSDESARYAIRLAVRPYALPLAPRLSAITVALASVESSITTRRFWPSFTRRPRDVCRSARRPPNCSVEVASTGPSCRTAGPTCADAVAETTSNAASAGLNMVDGREEEEREEVEREEMKREEEQREYGDGKVRTGTRPDFDIRAPGFRCAGHRRHRRRP